MIILEVPELAKLVIKLSGTQDTAKTGTYYMANINHPVIAALKRRYCKKKGINVLYPLSDMERTEFELYLLQPSIRKMIEDILTK